MSQALYRKYRTKSLETTVGQDHITTMLRRAIDTGRVSHAYLLAGPRGVGKTSIARIIAHEINGLPYDDDSTHLDIIEIDAASHTSVEDVRELRERAVMAPVSARKKVYIIDEVHMLSKSAFNALLKILEEPPEHVVFILATTDIDKLPATIVSRVQRFTFRAIDQSVATKHLRTLADAENIAIDDQALELIAEHGDGSFRDSISLLDQISSIADSDTTITAADVESLLGIAGPAQVQKIIDAHVAHDLKTIVALLGEHKSRGLPAGGLAKQIVRFVHTHVLDHPELLPLAEALLDISRSTQPYVKLLAVLGAPAAAAAMPATPAKPKTTAATATAPVVSAPAPVAKPPVKKAAKQAASPDTPPDVEPAPAPEPAADPTPEPPAAPSPISPSSPSSSGELDWQGVLAQAATKSIALSSLLKKCAYELDGNLLKLYTGNGFAKKRLDDAKYRMPLIAIVQTVLGSEALVETIGTAKPPADEKTAAIIELMGGGEVVDV